MDVRQSLLDLAARHHLDRAQTQQLLHHADLTREPPRLGFWLTRGVAVLAAGLSAMGVVMWIAANWDALGRLGHFALLQSLVVLTCLGANMRPLARAPLGLLALLGIGSLFAYFGQTYQTGADPWQLFAVWAALALPLCLGARSDVLWVPWALVVMTAISLWTHTYSGHRWSVEPELLKVHLIAWSATVILTALLSSGLQRFTGAGVWSFRAATTLAVMAVTAAAMGGLFQSTLGGQYPLGLLVLLAGAGVLCVARLFDIFALSAVALGLNALLVAGFARLLGENSWKGDWLVPLFLLGLFAAGLLAASVSGILRLSRRPYASPPTVGEPA